MRRRWRLALALSLGVLLLVLGPFVVNGVFLAAGESVVVRDRGASVASGPRTPGHLRVLAWNLAKCFVHHGGFDFEDRPVVEARLARMATVIRREQPDLVFLSEVVTECAPCEVDQVRVLAAATGMRYAAFGENYNIGWPMVRVVGGNAILSRLPIRPVGNPDLYGRRPFWVTRNNRRFLLCLAEIGGRSVYLGSMHTDSFDADNNARQSQQILVLTRDRPAILAGDFNAEPGSASMRAFADSGRFTGAFDGPPTFPTDRPDRRIDYVLAPEGWVLDEVRVLDDAESDHLAVLSSFTVRW